MCLERIRSFAIAGACLGAVVSTIGVGTLGAQSGRTSTFVAGVADAETGQPLEGAEVILLGVHRLARANAMGEATLEVGSDSTRGTAQR